MGTHSFGYLGPCPLLRSASTQKTPSLQRQPSLEDAELFIERHLPHGLVRPQIFSFMANPISTTADVPSTLQNY